VFLASRSISCNFRPTIERPTSLAFKHRLEEGPGPLAGGAAEDDRRVAVFDDPINHLSGDR